MSAEEGICSYPNGCNVAKISDQLSVLFSVARNARESLINEKDPEIADIIREHIRHLNSQIKQISQDANNTACQFCPRKKV